MSTAIEFEHVSKQYRLGLVSTKTLSHDIRRFWITNILGKEDPYLKIGETNDRASKGNSEYVWALRDIDFKVEQGDVVGIIGKNGAGKSTLLKLLSRVTGPTTGTIRAHGRIGSLLEVGTGFHGEMTGRENIFMNGAILGMSRAEIQSKLDEIIDFSGCERYIDTPVKRYSSGMTVRLGFAVAAFLEPEILVVDEVLAVGDAEFQKKAIGKMKDVSQGQGRTVLFVSHNMASVKNLCKHGVLLEKGMIKKMGDVNEVVDYYIGSNLDELYSYTVIQEHHHINEVLREIEYVEITMLNDCQKISNDETLHFEAIIKRNTSSIKRCQFGIVILNETDGCVGAMYSQPVDLLDGEEYMKVKIDFPHHQLGKGRYSLNFNICYNNFNAMIKDYDIVADVIRFDVNYMDEQHTKPFTMWYLGDVAYTPSLPTVEAIKKY